MIVGAVPPVRRPAALEHERLDCGFYLSELDTMIRRHGEDRLPHPVFEGLSSLDHVIVDYDRLDGTGGVNICYDAAFDFDDHGVSHRPLLAIQSFFPLTERATAPCRISS